MSGLNYTYIPLDSATLIQRKHPRDVSPPGLVEASNIYISRSDKTISLRPDLDNIAEYVLALGSKLKNGDVTETEFLNSVVGLYGTGELVWITSTVPVGSDNREIKCSILESAGTTVTVSGISDITSSTYLCTLSEDDVINANTEVWSGCYIKFANNYYLYRISSISSTTEFYIDEYPGIVLSEEFSIYRPHNILNSGYKANIQTFGSNLIYGIPCGLYNSEIDRIAGPFYSATIDATSTPDTYTVDINVIDSELDSGVTYNGFPIFYTMDSIIDDNTRYFGITPPVTLSGETPGIMTALASEIDNEDALTLVDDNLLSGITDTISFGSITSDGTDLYLSGQISKVKSESFSDGFEIANGYSIGDDMTDTSAWEEYDYNPDTVTYKIINNGGDQAARISWETEYSGYKKAYITWTEAESSISSGIFNYTNPDFDLYANFKIVSGYSDGTTRTAFAVGSGISYGIGYLIGHSVDCFYICYCTGTSIAVMEIFQSPIPEDGETYWIRVRSSYDDHHHIEGKIWQGEVEDEPSGWMAQSEQAWYTFGDMSPVVVQNISNYKNTEDPPETIINEISVTYSSLIESDRTTFVHKFDNSSTPVFSDVSPVDSFTQWIGISGYFESNFVYDSANSSLVLGFLDRRNYMNQLNEYLPQGVSYIRYSTDGGSNWSTPASMEGYFLRGLFYSTIDSKLYAPCVSYTTGAQSVINWDFVIRMSDDGGATWTDYVDVDLTGYASTGRPSQTNRCGFFEDDTNWCILVPHIGTNFYMFGGKYEWSIVGNSEDIPLHFLNNGSTDGTNYENILFVNQYNTNPTNKFLSTVIVDTTEETVNLSNSHFESVAPGDSFSNVYPYYIGDWENRKYVSLCPQAGSSSEINNVYYSQISPIESSGSITEAQVGVFTPTSDNYRSNVFSVLEGYLILFGTSEYEVSDDSWTYYPRRVRWTAPNTINDFSGVGSGVGDLPGNGTFTDARAVNGRIVTFESTSIGALCPRGIVADPWDYDVIHTGIRSLSNPVVVEDVCYFVASDGLLYSTNGISVNESGSSFDLSLFDDFEETSPVWLVYSSSLNSLLIMYPTALNNILYVISLATGSVSSFTIPLSNKSVSDKPFSIVAFESSSDQRILISYDKQSGVKLSNDGYDELVIAELSTGDAVTGKDSLYTSGDDHYWYGEFQTGNIWLIEEGVKVALKHIIISTYTNAVDGTTDSPDIIVEVKSLEDSEWNGGNEPLLDGEVTVTNAACTIDSSAPPTAMSTVLGTATGASLTYNLPWVAANCRIFTKTGSTYTACTLVTSAPTAVNTYQISGTQQIKAVGTAGHSVYCFCDNEPFIKVESGDYIESDEGLHRITSLTNYTTAALDRYRSTGSDTDAVHYSAEQMPVGHGQVKIGINRLVEGVQIRVRIIPRHASEETDQPSVAKITGISLGYIPLGEKIVEATGG